ncbi:hypothetical protein ABIE26_000280 [Pedobacter africanus]|uniref:Uncharacterized protein n=1 Tax=Pedobacter africanus TaxID=151894 RepID=A0ACC6KVQ2_9SPHI|nr:glycosyl hydrolase 115 family protein [Pedobacter africanus]MDR6783232.1 hypothetical protein [Pedobacter africanus]
MKQTISRKNFIKGCSATLGLMVAGVAKASFFESPEAAERVRGSWVRTGQARDGDILLQYCNIVVQKTEHTAVHQAALFLASDIEKISGHRPAVLEAVVPDAINIVLTTLGNGALPEDVMIKQLRNKWEAFCILTANNTVWLTGADFRGTAFAAYTLAERLGIDPLYLWTGYQPLPHANLTLRKTRFFADTPTVKYRGFFHDDEDVLPRPFDKYGFPLRIGDVSLEWYQRFFETALRLKMNMTAPYVRVHRRYEVQKCASDWGLFYTSHHYDILLSNPFGIERFHLADKRGVSTEWDWFKNKENMIRYWRGGVEENKALSAIWPVGLRGTDDHAYTFPTGTAEKEQAKVFREAIDAQVKTVKELVPSHEKPAFHFTLYTEMLEKYRKHPQDFNVPEDVILVWPDNNDGIMRDLPSGPDKWKHGVYYHLAYFGGPPTKQGTHVIAPSRIAGEFKRIVDSGATEFMLVNVSEMREHVMEARMIADICWNAPALLQSKDAAKTYLRWWAAEYFGHPNVDAVVGAYQDYYSLMDSSEKTYFGAAQFELILDQLHRRFSKKPPAKLEAAKIRELKERNEKFEAAFRNISLLRPKLNREQIQFFFEHIELGLRIDQRPTQAALYLLKALAEPGDIKAWAIIKEAMVPLEKLEVEILKAERPPFDKWYIPTWIRTPVSVFNIHRSYTQLREFMANNGTQTPIKPRMTFGHNIEGARLWSDFIEESARIKATY